MKELIPEKEIQNLWKMWFLDHPIFHLTENEIRELPEEVKIKYVTQWEDFFKNENTQRPEEFLINVRNLPRPELAFTHWMMDRLKEAMKQYAEGQWFSSIALCGALVEFIGRRLVQVSAENSGNVGTAYRMSDILRLLKDNQQISDREFQLLDEIRDLRNQHLHLKMLNQEKEEFKKANLKVLENLIEYLTIGPSWKRIMG